MQDPVESGPITWPAAAYPALRRRLWLVRCQLAARAAVRAVRLDRTPGERRLAAFLAAAVAALLLLAAAGIAGVPPAVGLPAVVIEFVIVLAAGLVFMDGPPTGAVRAERDRLLAVLPVAKRRWDEERQRARLERDARAAEVKTDSPADREQPAPLPPADPPAAASPILDLVLAADPPTGDWLRGDGTFPLAAVGESYHQRALEGAAIQVQGGDTVVPAVLRLEDNPYDRYAVTVVVAGRKVGHLARADARAFRLRIAGEGRVGPEFPCRAMIAGGGREPLVVRLDVRLYG